MDIKTIQKTLHDFAIARDWVQFHTPKNLAMALTVEASELQEIFQWLTGDQSIAAKDDPKTRQRLEEELADILIYAIRLADVLEIDAETAINNKISKNNDKYPADRVRGSAKKYDEYQ